MNSEFPFRPDEPAKRTPTPKTPSEQKADWLGWMMQFLFGFVVGGLGSGIFIEGGSRSVPLVSPEHAPVFSAGVGLLAAAVASRYGDQLWLGSSYRVIPPDAPQQSKASFVASMAAGVMGGLLVLVALLDTFGLGT